ncbi:MAG: hypothetical protein WD805_04440, partial [Gaiellaceae bacterium]
SYLTAPPRVAKARIAKHLCTIASVPWWTWVALGFFAAVVVAMVVFSALVFVRLQRLRDRGDILQAELEGLAGKAERLEGRLDRAEERAELARRSIERLDASLQRLSVLTWALGDARRAVTQLRSGLLRK